MQHPMNILNGFGGISIIQPIIEFLDMMRSQNRYFDFTQCGGDVVVNVGVV